MMKRCFLLLFLLILAPAAFAMPGDCFSTCDITAPCGTQTCQDCVWPYSDTECIQWGYAECQWYGLCGQVVCSTVREYDTYTPAGNWQYLQRACYIDGFNRQNLVDEYTKRYLKKRYRVTRCSNGTETTTLISEGYVYDHCYRSRFGNCSIGDRKVYTPYPSCPF